MKYLLDTNMCIYAQKKNQNVLSKIYENLQDGLAISSITLAELEYGVQARDSIKKNYLALMTFLSIVNVISFDSSAAEEYGKIRAYLRKKGTPIGAMDMLIVAHAKAENLTLVTNNVREFERVPDLIIENWVE